MKALYTLSIFTENKIGLLNRITAMFTRQHINIESITASVSELDGIYRYTIVIQENEKAVQKLVKQIEKQIDVLRAFYHAEADTVYQEIALYKMHIKVLKQKGLLEYWTNELHLRILNIEEEFLVLEKTGTRAATQQVLEHLRQYDLLEFVRSGRVAVTKPMTTLEEHLTHV
jgi:acetolactate synthase-1/3 small subunit